MRGCGEADVSSSSSSLGRSWMRMFLPRFLLLLLLPFRLLSRRASWGSRQYWLSWWRCHQSQMGGWGSGKGQSKCQGSEREGPRAGQGGNWEAPPAVFLLLTLLLLSPSASSAKAVASHPGGVLVWEPAPPYQERWPEWGRNRRTVWLDPLMKGSSSTVHNPVWRTRSLAQVIKLLIDA